MKNQRQSVGSADTYRTIKEISKGIFRDKGSRFLAFAHPVKTVDEAKSIHEAYRKEYHDARHHCYAYMIGSGKEVWRANDDGEPSGTAGKPILGQINSADLTNIMIVVVRYFGGTLLGTSGLINAYRSAAADALSSAKITECVLMDHFMLRFPWEALNDVMKIIKDEGLKPENQEYGSECSISTGIRQSRSEDITGKFRKIQGLNYDFKGTW